MPADVRTADTYNRRAGGHTSNQHPKTFEDEDDDEYEDDYRGDTLNGSKPARSSSRSNRVVDVPSFSPYHASSAILYADDEPD